MLGKLCACFILFFIIVFRAQTSLGNANVAQSMGTIASVGFL